MYFFSPKRFQGEMQTTLVKNGTSRPLGNILLRHFHELRIRGRARAQSLLSSLSTHRVASHIKAYQTLHNSSIMSTKQAEDRERQLEEMEAKAVDKAKASADAAFRPPPSVLNAQSAQVLLQQVDGPHSLKTYKSTESVYVGRSVPVAAGGRLNVPINVSTPGSVVAYAVELKALDINFGIAAEREEGITVVKVRS